MELIFDNQKAAAEAGLQPRFSMEEGLRKAIAFIEENLHICKTDIINA